MTEKVTSDEIDLMELLAKGYRGFKRNLLLFIMLPILGAGISLLIAYNSQDKFSSSMMIVTDLLSENEGKFVFEELGKADYIPGLSKEVDTKVLSLDFKVEERRVSEKDLDNRVYLSTTAVVSDPSVFPLLETAIVSYLNESDAVVRNRKNKEAFYRQMVQKIDTEIAGMNEVKKEADRNVASYVNPADLYAKSVELYEDRTRYEISLQNLQTVHIVKGFEALVKDAKLSKVVVALIGFVCGFLLVVIYLFVKFFNNYYTNYNSR